ncbi:MAG TPA: biosynthetic-type acetolactate synthase large subunit, partial [Amycolatopsis sp.]|nr:biosynthetic-type acetolactate synthase large subunit [Amycolatopsis sp.]
GYAQVTGRPGVCLATSGPGATNLVTPLADAHMDSVPMVAITGQVGRALIGSDAFQEADICAISRPITKWNTQVHDPRQIPAVIAEAFRVATSGRPGPVLVDIPKDVQQANTEFCWLPPTDVLNSRPMPEDLDVLAAARLLTAAHRPVLYVGGGVVKARASAELADLAELTGAPVVTTLTARGAFPDSHRQHLGMPGMHGSVPAVAAMQSADLLLAVGARFDDRVTGRLDSFAPEASIVHIDIDPRQIGKNRKADVALLGDARAVLAELVAAVRARVGHYGPPDLGPWWHRLDDWRQRYPLGYDWPADGSLSPHYVVQRIGQLVGPEAVYTAGVGQHQMWAAQLIGFERPGSFLSSGGLGTMGFAVPAAMGAKLGCPDREVWAIDGDGCFQMTSQEMVTCAAEGVPIKVAVINNGNLGMVRQWQNLFYEGRYSHSRLGTHDRLPDFARLAEAMGCVGLRAERRDEVDDVIQAARDITDRPVVMDFVVGQDAQVWPMVAAGAGNSEIRTSRDFRPLFDDDEL